MRRKFKIKELIHKRCGKYGYQYPKEGFTLVECKQCNDKFYILKKPTKFIIDELKKHFKIKEERDK